MERVYNFSAGPSALPVEVLEKAAAEMLNYGGTGMSVMEMSHRSAAFAQILADAKALYKELMGVPDNYDILFLQGGGSTQFAMIPLNLMTNTGKADFVITGNWAKKAFQEAGRYGDAQAVASSADKTFSYIPKLDASTFRKDADYFYICVNNTIYGTRFRPDNLPETGDVPLIADMSSNILSEVYDVSKFGLIFAGAQKNMGPAGVVAVIIRKDLVGHAMDMTPTMLNYQTHVDADSCYNTPPCYGIYICKLVYDWVKAQGGVAAMEAFNKEKSAKLYDFLDNSAMFKGTVVAEDRSLMNVPFVTGNEELDAKFVKEAKAAGLENLKGHRTVGGMRASIYNAMPMAGVDALIDFMKKFEMENK
ncbi:3-phosphoserine/phosphohydroxythreonine transaminase [Eubacterium sp. 1001713B170207_170306_E7]|uniref:3-phosphoserine/phosphohydroxythreonine transaminase n=1 Tax=Eubacterium sp. 1001713B170207_170306_E7 TaxID=2787097 RepID=UPI00189ADC44